MKAIIRSATKETLPRYFADVDKNVDTIVVVVAVDFVDDEGNITLSQKYSRLPEDFDHQEFDRIARSLQGDIDHTILHAEDLKRNKDADQVLEKLQGRLVKLELGDALPLGDQATVTKS